MQILDFRALLPAYVSYENNQGVKQIVFIQFNPRTLEVYDCEPDLQKTIVQYLKDRPGKWFVPPVPEGGLEKMDPRSFVQS